MTPHVVMGLLWNPVVGFVDILVVQAVILVILASVSLVRTVRCFSA